MALNTLLGQVNDEKLKKLPSRLRNHERIQQHIEAFGLHLQGVSYRGICDHFGWKGVATAQNSVKRGEILAKELNLDGEKIRLKLALFFEEICDITLNQIRQQQKDGQLTYVTDNQGNETISRRRGVDTRLLGEAGRGAIRFAQFAGLMDADKSSSGGADISTNVVFISPQADLSQWETRTIDVPASGPAGGPPSLGHRENPSQEEGEQLLRKQIAADGSTGGSSRMGQQGLG